MTSASDVAPVSASVEPTSPRLNRVLKRLHFRAPYPVREDLITSSSTTEFHKIWIDQCAATEDIRDHFGLHSALDYLIGGKLFSLFRAAEQDPLFAAEVPNFIGRSGGFFQPK
jgi:hypothetical protein